MKSPVSFFIVVSALLLLVPMPPRGAAAPLGDLQASYKSRCEEAVAERDQRLEKLHASYLAALERHLNGMIPKGDLAAVLPIRGEIDLVKEGADPLPEIPEAADAELRAMREKYTAARSAISTDHAIRHTELTELMIETLKAREAKLTQSGKIDEALALRKVRDALAEDLAHLRDGWMQRTGLGSLKRGLQLRYSFDRVRGLAVPNESHGSRGQNYPIDEPGPEGAADAAYDGKLASEPRLSKGIIEQALSTDGKSEWVELPAGVLGSRKSFSVSFWVKTSESRKGKNGQGFISRSLFAHATLGEGSGDFGIFTSEGKIGYWHGLRKGDSNHLSKSAIDDDKWHHVAFVADEARAMELYLDGDIVASGRAPTRAVKLKSFFLGASNFHGKPDWQHQGTFDELMIWDRPITPEEIQNLHSLSYRLPD